MAELFLELDAGGGETLQERIYRGVRASILHGRLRPGGRMPSSRDLAAELRVSRNTVILAYERLQGEGYLETRGGSGTFIAEAIPEPCLIVGDPPRFTNASTTRPRARAQIVFAGERPSMMVKGAALPIDFWYGRGNPHLFPTGVWRRLLMDHVASIAGNVSEYVPVAGLPELRKAIAQQLEDTRGIKLAQERVIVTAGAQEAFELIAKLFVRTHTRVAVEDPCYQGAAYAFRSHGAKLIGIPVDGDGLDVTVLEAVSHASLAYVTPSHQFPTGTTLPLERRLRLLNWARRTGAYVVEDDYDSDFRYDGPPLASLASLDDDGGTVIYVGTFSKSLGAGVALGFLVVPAHLLDVIITAKSLISHGQPWLEQAVLAEFLSSGGYRRHIRRLRHARRSARDTLMRSLRRHFGTVTVTGEQGGMHLQWWLSTNLPRAHVLAAKARALGVGIYPPGAAGAFGQGSHDADSLLLGYSALSEGQIEEGIARIARASA